MHASYLLYKITSFNNKISPTCFGSLLWNHHQGLVLSYTKSQNKKWRYILRLKFNFQFLTNEFAFLFSYFRSVHPTYVSAVTRPSSRYIDKFTDDGRVTTETYVGWTERKYENKKVHSLVQKLKINVKMRGEHNVKRPTATSRWCLPSTPGLFKRCDNPRSHVSTRTLFQVEHILSICCELWLDKNNNNSTVIKLGTRVVNVLRNP
jgi:hypothetical protein